MGLFSYAVDGLTRNLGSQVLGTRVTVVTLI